MNKRNWIAAALMGALLGIPVFAPGQDAKAPQPVGGMSPQAVNLVFLAGKQPVLVRINVLVDGKSVQACWNDYIERWFRHLDLKNAGMLSEDDLKLAPTEQGMLQVVRQGTLPPARTGMTPAQFGKKEGEKVTLAEFQAFYAKLVPAVQVSAQSGRETRFTEAGASLFKVLDANNDGKLSKEEVLAARKVLRKLDLNDDEWITVQELAPNTDGNDGFGNIFAQRVGGRGPSNSQINDAFLEVRPGEDRLGKVLLERFDKDKVQRLTQKDLGLDNETFAKLDKNGDGSLDREELNRWHERPADVEFNVRIGKKEGVELVKTREPFRAAVKEYGGNYHLSLEDCLLNVTTKVQDQNGGIVFFNGQQGLEDQFRQAAEAKKKEALDLKDLDGQEYQGLRQAFRIIDRDRDEKITLKEVQAYLALQAGANDCFVSLTMADQGRVLFQMLDTNGDGRLSQRELLNAWERLKTLDKNNRGYITTADLVRHFETGLQKGSGGGFGNFIVVNGMLGNNDPAPAPRYPDGTPDWFRRMDNNGDGDVSLAEFLGTRAEFERIDTDNDGLISPEEAIRYEAMRRQQGK